MRSKFRFTADFTFVVKPGLEIAYSASSELIIPEAHATAAKAAGAGDFVAATGKAAH